MVVLNSTIPLINYFKPTPSPPATKKEVEQLFKKYVGEKPNNPTAEEVKSEIDKELQAAF